MSSEIQLSGGPVSQTVYFTVRNLVSQIWNTNTLAFETPVNANQHYYAVPMTEIGTGTGYFIGTFPVGILTAGNYNISIFQQLGGTPAVTDFVIAASQYYWPGGDSVSGSDYITLAYLKTYLGSTTLTDAQLSQLITQASSTINDSLKRRINFTFYNEVQDGTGYSFLRTFNYPTQNISTIIENYQTNVATPYAGTFFVYNQEGTIRWQSDSGRCGFIPGFQNYLVSYSAGHNPIPQDLQLACCMYVQFLANFSQVNLLQNSIKNKDVTIAMGRALVGDFGSELFKPIETILARYRAFDTLG